MNQDIKKRWVKWLRENPDKQTYGSVSRNGCFCVLGALCHVIAPDVNWAHYLVPPISILHEAKLPHGVKIIWDGKEESLIFLNDDLKLSFPVLAGLIERQL